MYDALQFIYNYFHYLLCNNYKYIININYNKY